MKMPINVLASVVAVAIAGCGGNGGSSSAVPASSECTPDVPIVALLYPEPGTKGVPTTNLTVIIAEHDVSGPGGAFGLKARHEAYVHPKRSKLPSPLPQPHAAQPAGTILQAYLVTALSPKAEYTASAGGEYEYCGRAMPWFESFGSFTTK